MIDLAIPPLGGKPIKNLEFIGQTCQRYTGSEARERPVVPAFASTKPIAPEIEGKPWHKHHQFLFIALRHHDISGRLKKAISTGPELFRALKLDKVTTGIPGDSGIKDSFSFLESMIADARGCNLILRWAIERNRTGKNVGGKLKDSLLNQPALIRRFGYGESIPPEAGDSAQFFFCLPHTNPIVDSTRETGLRSARTGRKNVPASADLSAVNGPCRFSEKNSDTIGQESLERKTPSRKR
jgi:hypothetical protein